MEKRGRERRHEVGGNGLEWRMYESNRQKNLTNCRVALNFSVRADREPRWRNIYWKETPVVRRKEAESRQAKGMETCRGEEGMAGRRREWKNGRSIGFAKSPTIAPRERAGMAERTWKPKVASSPTSDCCGKMEKLSVPWSTGMHRKWIPILSPPLYPPCASESDDYQTLSLFFGYIRM